MHSRAIEEYKRGLRLTEAHQEILVGLLLGDGCLETQNGGRTYRLKVEQSARHEAYVRHIHELFSEWVLTPPTTPTQSGVERHHHDQLDLPDGQSRSPPTSRPPVLWRREEEGPRADRRHADA